MTHPKNPGESRSCFSAAIRPVLPHMFKRYWRVVWFVTQIIMTWALFLVLLLFSQVLQHGEGRMIERSNLNCGPLEIRRFRCVDPLQEQASGGRSESAQMSVHVGDEGAVTVVDKNSLEALSAQELRRSGLDCSLDDLSIHPIIDRLKPLQYNAYAGSLQAAQSSVHVEDDGVVAAGASKLSETESVGSTPFEARSLATNSSETLTVGGDRRSDLKCGPLEIHRYRCDPPQEPWVLMQRSRYPHSFWSSLVLEDDDGGICLVGLLICQLITLNLSHASIETAITETIPNLAKTPVLTDALNALS